MNKVQKIIEDYEMLACVFGIEGETLHKALAKSHMKN